MGRTLSKKSALACLGSVVVLSIVHFKLAPDGSELQRLQLKYYALLRPYYA